MNDYICCLPLKSVSGSEKSRSDHDGNQQRCIAYVQNDGRLNTCAQPGTPLINGFVDTALCGTDDVMATRHFRHCEILQGKVCLQLVH